MLGFYKRVLPDNVSLSLYQFICCDWGKLSKVQDTQLYFPFNSQTSHPP